MKRIRDNDDREIEDLNYDAGNLGSERLSYDVLRARLPFSAYNYALIEDFTNQSSGWTGNANAVAELKGNTSVRTLTASGGSQAINSYKAFSVPITIYNNCIWDVWITNKPNVASIYIRLKTDESNYFSFSYTSDFICEGINHINVPRSLSGSPNPANITSMQITVVTNANGGATASFGKIETYDRKAMCTLWFDDGTGSQYDTAFPAMKLLGMSGAMSIVISSIKAGGSNLTRQQHAELQAAGWDLCNHTFNHDDLTTIPIADAEYQVVRGKEYLRGMGVQNSANYLVLPYGNTNAEVMAMARKHATLIRLAGAADGAIVNLSLPFPEKYWYKIPSRGVLSTTTVVTVQEWIDETITKQKWLNLLFHGISATGSCTPENFQTILNYLNSNVENIRVATPSEVIACI